jgi:hypothetical protein
VPGVDGTDCEIEKVHDAESDSEMYYEEEEELKRRSVRAELRML